MASITPEHRNGKLINILFILSVIANSYASSISPVSEQYSAKIHLNDGSVISPSGILEFASNEFIVTGEVDRKAWIARIGNRGEIKWQYKMEMDEVWAEQSPNSFPEFFRPIQLQDNSIAVIGQMPRPFSSTKPKVVVLRFDMEGNLLSKKWNDTKFGKNPRIADDYIESAKLSDGVVALGIARKVLRFGSSGVTPIVANYYWLARVSNSGELEEKFIPDAKIAFGLVGDLGIMQLGERLLIVASDNTSTELMVIGPTGAAITSKLFAGRYLLVRSVGADSRIQLLGRTFGESQTTVISLDGNLNEIGRVEGYPHLEFTSFLILRLSDSSFLLAGNSRHEFGEEYSPAILHLDAALKHFSLFNNERPSSYVPTFLQYGASAFDGHGVVTFDLLAVPRSSPEDIGRHSENGAIVEVFRTIPK